MIENDAIKYFRGRRSCRAGDDGLLMADHVRDSLVNDGHTVVRYLYRSNKKKEIHVNIHSVPLDYNPTEMLSNVNGITMAEWRVHRQ